MGFGKNRHLAPKKRNGKPPKTKMGAGEVGVSVAGKATKSKTKADSDDGDDDSHDIKLGAFGMVSDAAANYDGRFEALADPVEEAVPIAAVGVGIIAEGAANYEGHFALQELLPGSKSPTTNSVTTVITSVVSDALPNYAGHCDATEDRVEEADNECFDATVDPTEDLIAAEIGMVSDAAVNYDGRFEAPADPVEEAAVITDLAVVVASADKEAGRGVAKVTTDNLSFEFATEESDNSDALPLGQMTLAAAQHLESVYLYNVDNEQEIILKDRESRRTHWEVLMHFMMRYPNVIRPYGRVHVRNMLCKLLCSACSDPADKMGSLVEWSVEEWQSLLDDLEKTRNACSRVDCGVSTPAAVAVDEAGTVEDNDKVNYLCDKKLFVDVQAACEINKQLGTIRSKLQMQIDSNETGVPNLNQHDVVALLRQAQDSKNSKVKKFIYMLFVPGEESSVPKPHFPTDNEDDLPCPKPILKNLEDLTEILSKRPFNLGWLQNRLEKLVLLCNNVCFGQNQPDSCWLMNESREAVVRKVRKGHRALNDERRKSVFMIDDTDADDDNYDDDEDDDDYQSKKVGRTRTRSSNVRKRIDLSGSLKTYVQPKYYTVPPPDPGYFDDKGHVIHKRSWSVDETNALVEGVGKFGSGNWQRIKHQYGDILKNRTNVQLKDRWRVIGKEIKASV